MARRAGVEQRRGRHVRRFVQRLRPVGAGRHPAPRAARARARGVGLPGRRLPHGGRPAPRVRRAVAGVQPGAADEHRAVERQRVLGRRAPRPRRPPLPRPRRRLGGGAAAGLPGVAGPPRLRRLLGLLRAVRAGHRPGAGHHRAVRRRPARGADLPRAARRHPPRRRPLGPRGHPHGRDLLRRPGLPRRQRRRPACPARRLVRRGARPGTGPRLPRRPGGVLPRRRRLAVRVRAAAGLTAPTAPARHRAGPRPRPGRRRTRRLPRGPARLRLRRHRPGPPRLRPPPRPPRPVLTTPGLRPAREPVPAGRGRGRHSPGRGGPALPRRRPHPPRRADLPLPLPHPAPHRPFRRPHPRPPPPLPHQPRSHRPDPPVRRLVPGAARLSGEGRSRSFMSPRKSADLPVAQFPYGKGELGMRASGGERRPKVLPGRPVTSAGFGGQGNIREDRLCVSSCCSNRYTSRKRMPPRWHRLLRRRTSGSATSCAPTSSDVPDWVRGPPPS
ncbi:hypothetical protein SBRY_110092 [Actinacidiphila bryophytorum]|uniref:Uncharacterized protein n=1 Tax=Actinacidiphila bryophytorum TaxID=1436133 RepID=A0A9W4GYN8_9ACTN|nr:hypothetical protein SBRY_110092 [Actinacidiphila bryophytorum]